MGERGSYTHTSGQGSHARKRSERTCSDCALAKVVGQRYHPREPWVECAAGYWAVVRAGGIPEEEAQRCELYDDMSADPDEG